MLKFVDYLGVKFKNVINWLSATDDEQITKFFKEYVGDKNLIYRRLMAMRFSVCILRSAIPTFAFMFVLFIMIFCKLHNEEDLLALFKYACFFIFGYITLLFASGLFLIIIGWIMPSNAMDKIKINIGKEGASFEAGTNEAK